MIEIGTVIAGRYRVTAEIGRGGMGTVYRVEHVETGELYALKVMTGTTRFDPQAIARFRREARATARIESEHVIRVMEADTASELDGSPFIVMELLDGVDLERLVVEEGPLAPARALALLEQVALALETAHEQGVIHRDLKPENLFLHRTSDGRAIAKVLDFGISKLLTPQMTLDGTGAAAVTSTGSVLGTPLYMAPEQAHGENDKISAATDVWAMGLVTLRLLTGQHYWGAPTMAELMMKIAVKPIVPPSERWPGHPLMTAALDAWFLRSCRRAPAERYPSVSEQFRALSVVFDAGGAASSSLEPADVVSAKALTRTRRARLEQADTEEIINPERTTAPLPAPTSSRARRFAVMGILATAAVGLGAIGLNVRARSQSNASNAHPVTPAESPLRDPNSVLACAIFESSGTVEPGWLGAAAADFACREAAWMMGGRPERIRTPASLLGLPMSPVPDFPEEPYTTAGARERALAGASSSHAILDGRVDKRGRRFDVRAELRSKANGTILGAATSSSEDFHEAIELVVKELGMRGVIPRAERLHPASAEWNSFDDVDAAMFFERFVAIQPETEPFLSCAGFEKRAPSGPNGDSIRAYCGGATRALDRSSLGATISSIDLLPSEEAKTMSVTLRQAREAATSPSARALLLQAEGNISYVLLKDSPGAEASFRAAAAVNPILPQIWGLIYSAASDTQSGEAMKPAIAAARAWEPAAPSSYARTMGERRAIHLRRARELMPRSPHLAVVLAGLLADQRALDDVRAMAVELSSGTEQDQRSAELVLAYVDLGLARFAHAIERLENLIASSPVSDDMAQATNILMGTAVALNLGPSVADRWLERNDVSKWIPPLSAMQAVDDRLLAAIHVAMRASPAKGRAAVAQLRPHVVDPNFIALLDGGERWLRGDAKGASDAWRSVLHTLYEPYIDTEAFIRVGAFEAAKELDEKDLERFHLFGGVGRRNVRAARHAAARGDIKRARELAREIVDAWSRADMEIPAITEMRAILARP